MENITQKLILGIIALLCAFVFIFLRERIEEKIMNSHEKFWKQTLKLQNEVGRFGELFLKAIILFLGISFFLIGILLIYQFIKKGA